MLLKELIHRNRHLTHAAVCHGKRSLSYQQLSDDIEDLSREIGKILPGKAVVGIFMPNSIEYIQAYFSIAELDHIIVPIDPRLVSREIVEIMRHCDITLVITSAHLEQQLLALLTNPGLDFSVLSIENSIINQVYISQSSCLPSTLEHTREAEDSIALLLGTSGTTSSPKRVMLSHKNLFNNINSHIESLSLCRQDKVLIALPMHFGYCNTAQLLAHIWLGATIVIMEGVFESRKFFAEVQQHSITNFTAVPTMLKMLLLRYRSVSLPSLRLICFGGSPMHRDDLCNLMRSFPTVTFVQTYGLTEASPRVTALLPPDTIRKIGSIGKPIPNVEVDIVDESGFSVAACEVGELIIKGDNVMKGYYKNPSETRKAIRDGWLFSGDLAQRDEEGFIYLVGRKKNVIITGGINIQAEEIEDFIRSHPSINDVLVQGKCHSLLGEVPVAYIVLEKSQARPTPGELREYCFRNMAPYKIPEEIFFVDSLPRTFTGKIRRSYCADHE
jgi:long-chain acyl-CoA synthetase